MSSSDMFHSVIATGQTALKSALLINGGAAVALLAFIGNVWVKGTSQAAVNSLTSSIASFSFGVLLAAIASGTTYLTQYGHHHKWGKLAVAFHVITVALVLASYVLFALGTYNAYSAFTEHLVVTEHLALN